MYVWASKWAHFRFLTHFSFTKCQLFVNGCYLGREHTLYLHQRDSNWLIKYTTSYFIFMYLTNCIILNFHVYINHYLILYRYQNLPPTTSNYHILIFRIHLYIRAKQWSSYSSTSILVVMLKRNVTHMHTHTHKRTPHILLYNCKITNTQTYRVSRHETLLLRNIKPWSYCESH